MSPNAGSPQPLNARTVRQLHRRMEEARNTAVAAVLVGVWTLNAHLMSKDGVLPAQSNKAAIRAPVSAYRSRRHPQELL